MIEPETMRLGETTFKVGKLPATQMWDLSVYVANALGDNGTSDGDGQNGDGLNLVKAIMTLPPSTVRYVRDEMFQGVEFTNHLVKSPQRLQGMEETAFNAVGLGSIDIWKVFVKAFQINFTEYWAEFNSQMPAAAQRIAQSLQNAFRKFSLPS